MSLLVVIIHVIVCIALILIVLLQTGKGADMGAAFGGGASQTLFGTSGASTFLTKLTTGAAIVFMLTSLTLAYMRSERNPSSILTTEPAGSEEKATEPAPTGGTDQTAPPAGDTQTVQPPADAQAPAAPEAQGGTPPETTKETPQ